MSEKLGIGIIGYGGFGPFVHKAWNSLDDAEVRAVSDMNPERHPEDRVHFTTDWTELLDDARLDIIAVITPPSTHADIAHSVMESGKHLLVDKPIATTLEDAQMLIETRDKTGSIAAVNFMLRFNPLVRQMVRWGADNSFGSLRHAAVENVAQDDNLAPEHWFWNSEISGGILVEHAGHFVDFINAIAHEKPASVTGSRLMRNEAQEDQTLAVALYNSGLVATHYHEFSRPRQLETTTIRLVFEMAQVDLSGWIPLEGEVTALTDEVGLDLLKELPGWVENENSPAADTEGRKSFYSAGKPFSATRLVRGRFAVQEQKQEVYASCLRGMMNDVVQAILDPSHKVEVPLEDGYSALETALLARDAGRTQHPA